MQANYISKQEVLTATGTRVIAEAGSLQHGIIISANHNIRVFCAQSTNAAAATRFRLPKNEVLTLPAISGEVRVQAHPEDNGDPAPEGVLVSVISA